MRKTGILLASMAILLLLSCRKEQIGTDPGDQAPFSVDAHHLIKDGTPFPVKGVVYVPGYPGFLPWEIENSVNLNANLRSSIDRDIQDIKALGANTIRLWGAPAYCYEAIRNVGGLQILQTIWIDGKAPYFQDAAFKEQTKGYIESVVDRVYGAFPEGDPPILAFLVGNELSAHSIQVTDAAMPGPQQFSGNFIRTENNLTATEAFLAEMADHLKTYEFGTYGRVSLVSYANEIRTIDLIDTPFLDFRCQNAYSYAVPYYRPGTAPGSSSGTQFQGWVEELKAAFPDMPLLITETGLSVSPNAPNMGPPNYGYGGNTETEQADGLLQNISDIETATMPLAGVCIHEYLDAWWKFGLSDSYTQDPDDIEEWFGMARLQPVNNWYETSFRPSYLSLQQLWGN